VTTAFTGEAHYSFDPARHGAGRSTGSKLFNHDKRLSIEETLTMDTDDAAFQSCRVRADGVRVDVA
jgi:hypothetical protein